MGCPNWSAPFIADNFQCLCGDGMNSLSTHPPLFLSLSRTLFWVFLVSLCLSVAWSEIANGLSTDFVTTKHGLTVKSSKKLIRYKKVIIYIYTF